MPTDVKTTPISGKRLGPTQASLCVLINDGDIIKDAATASLFRGSLSRLGHTLIFS
jgi:hypothetical protein